MTCPYCGGEADAEFVDVGVGPWMQVTAAQCRDCEALQMNPYNDNDRATEEEKRTGWWRGPPEPNPYATEPENIALIKAGMLRTPPPGGNEGSDKET